jgi:hypothetical protein
MLHKATLKPGQGTGSSKAERGRRKNEMEKRERPRQGMLRKRSLLWAIEAQATGPSEDPWRKHWARTPLGLEAVCLITENTHHLMSITPGAGNPLYFQVVTEFGSLAFNCLRHSREGFHSHVCFIKAVFQGAQRPGSLQDVT